MMTPNEVIVGVLAFHLPPGRPDINALADTLIGELAGSGYDIVQRPSGPQVEISTWERENPFLAFHEDARQRGLES